MADESGGTHEATPAEEMLERRLAELGPLLRRRREVGAPDAAFVARLRARLLSAEGAGVQTHVVPAEPGAGATGAVSGGRRDSERLRWGVLGLVAALAAALLIVLVMLVETHHPTRTPTVAWRPPLPSLADLTRGFPAPPVAHVSGMRDPTVSVAALPHGVPYGGRVTLSTVPLPARAFRLLAARLADPAAVASVQRVALIARRLGLRTSPGRITRGHISWLVVAEGGSPSRRPLHSVAVSSASGELVYHDASYPQMVRREAWRDNPSAVAAARAWLTRLGWPGAQMPLTAIEHSGLPFGVREIEFAWDGTGTDETDAATLWVTPQGHVVEADVWPPAQSIRTVAARSLSAAWAAVRARLLPLGVEGVLPAIRAPGMGLMRHVTVTQVLTTGPDHRLYLVPVYHFAGTARLRGIHGARTCYALAPAGQA